MGLWSFIFATDNEDQEADGETLDPDLLYPLAGNWLGQAVTEDDEETAGYRWDAVEYADVESGGGFWAWLTGG